jgi:hypothetical protein
MTGANIGDAFLRVVALQDGNPINPYLIYMMQLPGVHTPPGNYNVPFTVADTGGNPSTIQIQVYWQAGNFMVGPGTVNGSGFLTP